MAETITFEKFERYARKILDRGLPVCPCCLHKGLSFTTDDGHSEFWIECRACRIQARDQQFSRARSTWEHRSSKDPALHEITRDISCEFWDDGINDIRYVALPDKSAQP